MPSSRREIDHSDGENSTMREEAVGDESSKTTSLFIVIISLVFVAIFGGALVGGVVSGDPTNGFFITIIVASAVAISVALGVSVRYFLMNRGKDGDNEYLSKEDVRGTFSNSDEENHNEEEYFNRHSDHQPQDYRYPTHTPIESQIKEIQAKSVYGEMSAMSPQTYDEESLSTFRHHIKDQYNADRRGFDFSSVTSIKRGPKVNARQDPPEGAGLATIQAAWITRGSSQDPSAPKFSTDGEIISDDEYDRHSEPNNNRNDTDLEMNYSLSEDKSIVSGKSGRSRYTVASKTKVENIFENREDENTVTTEKRNRRERSEGVVSDAGSANGQYRRRSRESRRSRSRSRSKSKSPSASQSAKSASNSEANSLSSKRKQKGKKIEAPQPPFSTKSGATNSVVASSVPATPAASEAGSFASSFFKPLNEMFGKNKKTSSVVGTSDAGSTHTTTLEPPVVKEKVSVGKSNESRPPMVRPPMMPSNRKGGNDLKTIGGHIGPTPSTPGNKSTFTIPPPRPIPRTPMGSQVFSEFQSVAGSAYSNGAASSTFDPQAHERALKKMRKNQASIGANPVDDNDMPIYYDDDDDDDDDDDKESSVAPTTVAQSLALAYDVFAPPGAIGIVVDTTDKGCIVHSLKKSSPMQGLMNRGDLIIGLDNFDVRNMSAASLTKLMAKKSQQSERKFTLVPNNY